MLLLLLLLLCRPHLDILPCLLRLMLPSCILLLLARCLCLDGLGLLCRLLSWHLLLSWQRCIIHWKVESVLLLPRFGRQLVCQLGLGRDGGDGSGWGSAVAGSCHTLLGALASWRCLLPLLLLWLCWLRLHLGRWGRFLGSCAVLTAA